MSYGAYLRELLRPLRIYGLEGTANGGELEAQGKALDGVEAAMEEVQREMLICTAEGRGLEAVEALLARKPVAASLERRRAALAALLRIGGDSFTLTAINDNLRPQRRGQRDGNARRCGGAVPRCTRHPGRV